MLYSHLPCSLFTVIMLPVLWATSLFNHIAGISINHRNPIVLKLREWVNSGFWIFWIELSKRQQIPFKSSHLGSVMLPISPVHATDWETVNQLSPLVISKYRAHMPLNEMRKGSWRPGVGRPKKKHLSLSRSKLLSCVCFGTLVLVRGLVNLFALMKTSYWIYFRFYSSELLFLHLQSVGLKGKKMSGF